VIIYSNYNICNEVSALHPGPEATRFYGALDKNKPIDASSRKAQAFYLENWLIIVVRIYLPKKKHTETSPKTAKNH